MLVITGRRTASKLSLAITAEHSQFGVAILSNGGTMLALLSWPLVFEAHSVGYVHAPLGALLTQANIQPHCLLFQRPPGSKTGNDSNLLRSEQYRLKAGPHSLQDGG
jgi:hypothetical protein